MSIYKKIHDTLRSIVTLAEFPVLRFADSSEPNGGSYRRLIDNGASTERADGFDAAPVQYTVKAAEDDMLFGDHKPDIDVRRWVCVVSVRGSVDPENFLKSVGRTIPEDDSAGTPLLNLRLTGADVEIPPVADPSSGTYIRMELEITAGPVSSV